MPLNYLQKIVQKIPDSIKIPLAPITCYFVYKLIIKDSSQGFVTELICGTLFFALLILCSSFYITQLVEFLSTIERKKISYKTIGKVTFNIISLSACFATFYWCIHDNNALSFNNVDNSGWTNSLLDFFILSIGIFCINNQSIIEPVTIVAKLFTTVEVICSFVTIILIIANRTFLKKDKLI